MRFLLSKLSISNGARYLTDENEERKLMITVNITSKIEDFPYPNKFEQIDYNVNLELPENKTGSELDALLPEIAQNWINEKYPDII